MQQAPPAPDTLERIVMRTALRFLSVEPGAIDDAISEALGDIGEFAGVDRSYLFQRTSPALMTNTHEWCAPGIDPVIDQLVDVPVDVYPWFWSRIRARQIVHVPQVSALPPDAEQDRLGLEAQGVRSVVAVPTVSGDEVVGFIGFDAVRTEISWSEEDLALLEAVSDMFVHAIEQRTATRRMETLIHSKDEFLASISHELRTPLTAVLGLAAELFDGLERFAGDEIREFAGVIAEQSTELARIVEDLLVVARADIGQVAVSIEGLDPAIEVDDVVRALPPAVRGRIEVHAGGDIRVEGDAMRVRQIIRNLVTNALRYGEQRVWIDVLSVANEWGVVRVRDDGPGVPPDEREAVFSPYQRSQGSPTLPGSIGIGLTVARKLARLMGGDVLCLPGDTGWFELRLPLA